MIGDVMGAVRLNFRRDGILHDVVETTYRQWRISCEPYAARIDAGSRLSDADDTNCMVCIAVRK